MLLAVPAAAAPPEEDRHFDARRELRRGLRIAPTAEQDSALASLQARVPELAFSRDDAMGTLRTLASRTGYLTERRPGDDALAIATGFVQDNLALLGLEPEDLAGYEVTDRVYSRVTGATHIYLRQRHLGIPVYNGQLHVNVNREGRVLSVNNAFVPGLRNSLRRLSPGLGVAEAVRKAAEHVGLTVDRLPKLLETLGGAQQRARLEHLGISRRPIEGRLMWLPLRRGEAELVWNFQIETPDERHYYDYTVSAGADGAVWTRVDWTSADQYTVYPLPVESPNHTSPLPPADGRVAVSDPANATASPYGWHDTNGAAGAEYTIMRGNNVHAYDDRDNNNAPPASQPDCGPSLLCNFALDLTQAPTAYIPAAVANLFYWNNIVHDVQYQYGFDEAAGNFQQNNYGRGSAGSDYVQAEAQDGSGTNNANFSTPPDGSRPRMQMYTWTAPNPDKDGDFDDGIIIHEYGHGISNRLVGGPSNVSCLGNSQQAGEGLSDWWALAYTGEVGDQGTDPRGIGTYALDQPTTGVGIRTQRYSTDPTVNTWTYASISGMAIPHGVGSVWAQAAWEVYWKLVDHWGFDANLYNATGGAGNQRAMLYVNEGLKNTACSPTFTDVRDGIVQAAVDNHGGEDVCRIWEAFAAFGLGTDAVSGGSNSTSPTNGFALPAECGGPSGGAAYDSTLKAPKCAEVGSVCDSGTLLNGRDGKGPEPNQPNTINNSCSDGTSGTYHSDESNDKIVAQTTDGTDFAPGKTVRIDATVWAWNTGSADTLDLYYAADATNPSWTHIASLTPPGGGQRVLSATYTLPSGSLQAVRARFRYQGSQAPCGTGSYDDHDDLVFAVGGGGGDTTPPTTSITAPSSGATLKGTTTVSASASDDVGVTKLEFFVDGALAATDTTSPYSFAWDTTTVGDGSHNLQSKAHDAAGNVGSSSTVTVTVDNTAPTTSITAPSNGATVSGTTTVTASASDAIGVTQVEFYVDGALAATDTTAPYSFAWDTTTVANGSHTLQSRGYDAAGNVGVSATVTVSVSNVGGGGGAVFDPALQAPACGTLGSICDSGTLLVGRANLGPEPNQPNTINDSCADGTSGTYHSDESNDRIVVQTTDGTSFAPGKTVRIDATVWAWSTGSADTLDLYYAADAANPSWTYITSMTPSGGGERTLSATYTLPAGASLQAVRANFRYQGSASPCSGGSYDDHDDLVFAVAGGATTVFFDDFETDQGWTRNPSGTDTATTGLWERGNPEGTNSSGPKQLDATVSGVNDLVTGRLAGSSAGTHDIDAGVTTIRSPNVALPSGSGITLSFSYYFAHASNSSSADFLRVKVVGSTTGTVFEELGAGNDDDAVWEATTASLDAWAGQTVYLLVEAADASGASLVEAALDDVKITQ